jgi:hypothetical protein
MMWTGKEKGTRIPMPTKQASPHFFFCPPAVSPLAEHDRLLIDAEITKFHVFDRHIAHIVWVSRDARFFAVALRAKQHTSIVLGIIIVVTFPPINLVKLDHTARVCRRAVLIWCLEARLWIENVLA